MAKQPARVLHIYKDYFPVLGGIENHVRLLAEAQVQRGLAVTVLVTSLTRHTTVETINGVRVVKAARLATVASTPLSLSLFAWVRRLDADIAHLHFPYPIGEMAQLFLGRSQRTVITYHSDVVRQQGLLRLYTPFLWRVLARADRILPTSPQYVQTSPYLSRFANRCTVVPLGIDLQPFLTADQAQAAALRARYAAASRVLLFVGRLRYYKGLEYLIQALPQIAGQLWVIGSGPMEDSWRALTRDLGLGDRVRFLGEVPDADLPAHYAAADLFVLPASQRSEAFGAVMIEAMAAGLPVVCTELGTGTSFVNVDGVTGRVVPPRDPTALAAAINALLSDEAMRRAMGARARERAQQEFSLETMVDRVLAVYEEILP